MVFVSEEKDICLYYKRGRKYYPLTQHDFYNLIHGFHYIGHDSKVSSLMEGVWLVERGGDSKRLLTTQISSLPGMLRLAAAHRHYDNICKLLLERMRVPYSVSDLAECICNYLAEVAQ